jgi:hypothetical protein
MAELDKLNKGDKVKVVSIFEVVGFGDGDDVIVKDSEGNSHAIRAKFLEVQRKKHK